MLDKLSYAAGDFGCNMSFSLAGTYFTLFYTQYMGIDSLAFAGILALRNFARNRPALGAKFPMVAMYVGTYGAATATTVMFQSYFQNTSVSGLLSLMSYLPMFLFMPFIRKITLRWGKKEASQFGCLFSILATVLMLVLPIGPNASGMAMFFACPALNGFGMGIYMCVSNAMMADAIDYNEWKNGTREEGTTYALHSFFRKLAQGVGPSIGLVLMVRLGYDEALGSAQPFAVAQNMRYLVAAMYCVSAVLMWVSVDVIYNLDKKTLAQMEKDLGRTS